MESNISCLSTTDMLLELLDEPVLLLRSYLSGSFKGNHQGTLQQIESLLEEEIEEVREQLRQEEGKLLESYMLPFSLHVQTNHEVNSVLLEREWGTSDEEESAAEEQQVSHLLRVLKITYEYSQERTKIFHWLSLQNEDFPFIHGFASSDYLLLPAHNILSYMNSLHSISSERTD